MWRPDNWATVVNRIRNIDEHKGYDVAGECKCKDCRLIEDGADAMLEALKADKVEIGTVFSSSGWLVFIPDKE